MSLIQKIVVNYVADVPSQTISCVTKFKAQDRDAGTITWVTIDKDVAIVDPVVERIRLVAKRDAYQDFKQEYVDRIADLDAQVLLISKV